MQLNTVAEALKVFPKDKLLTISQSTEFKCVDDLDKFCLILHEITSKKSFEFSINDLIDNVSIPHF